jgi:hypothetical protein
LKVGKFNKSTDQTMYCQKCCFCAGDQIGLSEINNSCFV